MSTKKKLTSFVSGTKLEKFKISDIMNGDQTDPVSVVLTWQYTRNNY